MKKKCKNKNDYQVINGFSDSLGKGNFGYESRFSQASTYDSSNWFSKFFLGFVYPIFYQGYKQNGLEFDDLQRCSVDDEAAAVSKLLIRNWNEARKQNAKPNFASILIKTNIRFYIFSIIVQILSECVLKISIPLMLDQLIRYFNHDSTISTQTAWLHAMGINLCMLLGIFVDHPLKQYYYRLGMRQRCATSSLIYQKALLLRSSALQGQGQASLGQLINILSNDVNRFDDIGVYISYLVIAPIQSALIIYIVWGYLGPSTLIGVVILLLFIPFQAFMGKLFSGQRSKIAKFTDTRLRFMNEIISGIRLIKMYCWEGPFSERVSQARSSELSQIRKTNHLQSLNESIFFVSSRLIQFACFVCFILLGNVLTPTTVFVTASLFNTIRVNMTHMFPQAVAIGAELLVICRRIENFLVLDEIQEDLDANGNIENNNFEPCVKVDNICAKWSEKQNISTLENISVDLNPGDLLVVIGPVGSGKSSFLQSLLRELSLTSGSINLNGSLSYASQDAWIFPDSIRENILFGFDFDEKKYRKVIQVCALERDLRLLPHGDHTLVGEKGVTLSGGQKARVNLARAIYRDTDIVLMDDPLSAVDAPVAKHIFERCILDHLKPKIRILVTHQIQYVEKATRILILRDGKCWAYGTYAELREKLREDFIGLGHESEDSGESKIVDIEDLLEYPEKVSLKEKPKIKKEKLQHGSISCQVYLKYLKAGSSLVLFSTMILFTIISQALFHGSDYYLSEWTNRNMNKTQRISTTNQNPNQDIIVYTVLIVGLFITTVIRASTFFAFCLSAARNLHNSIFKRLLNAPVKFFDQNPSGRILNRFSPDLRIIDDKLPFIGFDLNVRFGQLFGVIILVSLINWYLIIPALVLIQISWYIQNIYIKSSIDIKRFEASARSPIYSHVSTTINGLASIRAFKAKSRLERQFHGYLNDHTSIHYLNMCTARVLGMVIEFVTVLYILIITLSIMFTPGIEGGTVGLVLSSALMLAQITQFGVRQTAELENLLTSVERIVEYQELDQEISQKHQGNLILQNTWPVNGEIEFQNLNLSYQKDKPVLNDLTFKISGGEKIGIVGRTGAGKSSLIGALFRLTEPDDEGLIKIDNRDICAIPLDRLRRSISIIPQDPVIFTGSVRYNLDPFSQFQDDLLWDVLEQVQLKDQVKAFTGKLDEILTDNGSNLSVGQRQLICLARAMLRQNKILVLDEATANVDHQLDQLIQQTLRTRFSDCTVLTVAHRLNTIIDCDRVLVMDAGRVLEFDHPHNLLQKNGVFAEMCQKSGTSQQLTLAAKNAYEKYEKQFI